MDSTTGAKGRTTTTGRRVLVSKPRQRRPNPSGATFLGDSGVGSTKQVRRRCWDHGSPIQPTRYTLFSSRWCSVSALPYPGPVAVQGNQVVGWMVRKRARGENSGIPVGRFSVRDELWRYHVAQWKPKSRVHSSNETPNRNVGDEGMLQIDNPIRGV